VLTCGHNGNMQKPRAEIFTANAEKLEARSRLASDKDHPKWLRGIAKQLRKRATAKERAFEHRQKQRKRKRV